MVFSVPHIDDVGNKETAEVISSAQLGGRKRGEKSPALNFHAFYLRAVSNACQRTARQKKARSFSAFSQLPADRCEETKIKTALYRLIEKRA